MHDPHDFLSNLALVLCVAAVTTVVLQRLRMPLVLGYIVAGFIIGPHVFVPLVVDEVLIRTLSELGVILVMFSIGLEFSLRRLFRTGIVAGLIACIEVSLMLWLGFSVARLFDWSVGDAILTAAAVSISSTTIIAKAFEEQAVRGRIREIVFGVLIFEDLIAIVMLAILPAVSARDGSAWDVLLTTMGRLGLFLAVLLVAGMLVVPRLLRMIVRLRNNETTLVASVGLCFATAILVARFGYSVALGAFLAGSLIAESGTGPKVEHLIKPVRDMFAAVFFVSVGMLVDPSLVGQHWPALLVLSIVVILGKMVAVSLAAFLTGNGVRDSVQSGMSMAQIGEFSFILVGMGVELKVGSPFLFPIVVAVSFTTTLVTPLWVRVSRGAAARAQERLPASLQTFTALYATWVEKLRPQPGEPRTRFARVRRLAVFLFVDALAVTAGIVSASLIERWAVERLVLVFGLSPPAAQVVVVLIVILVIAPFVLGVVRLSRGLGLALAELALPRAQDGKLDLAAAPRRMLVVTLQLAVVLAVGLPIIAITQPFLPPFRGAAVLAFGLVALGLAFWRSATNLQGHVRAGAQVVVEVLAAQGAEPGRRVTGVHPIVGEDGKSEGHDDDDVHHGPEAAALKRVREALPGLGAPVPLTIPATSKAVGSTLVDLNFRGLTGATVLAIVRASGSVVVPTGSEVLCAGDVLAVAGTNDAVAAARALLRGVSVEGVHDHGGIEEGTRDQESSLR